MKAITLWQPYASLISCGVKTIESRSWPTSYRGPLLIHAAHRPVKPDDLEWVNAILEDAGFRTLGPALPCGCLVALCVLVDCVECGRRNLLGDHDDFDPLQYQLGDLSPGHYAWLLKDVVPIDPPVPCRGRQGIWTYDGEVNV